MLAAGYRWADWYALPPVVRGRLRAHFVEKAAYEAYEMAAMDPSGGEKKTKAEGIDGFLGRFWGPTES